MRQGGGRPGSAGPSWTTTASLLAGATAVGLSMVGLTRSAKRRRAAIEEVRSIASALQRGLLPDDLAPVAGVEMAVRYESAVEHAQIGGDWYDAFPTDDGALLVGVGDVSGHGVPAMATMARLLPALRAHGLRSTEPASLAGLLHEHLRAMQGDRLCTACLMRLDPEDGSVSYVRAGHPPPLVVRGDGGIEVLDGGAGLVLGPDTDADLAPGQTSLEPGEVLVLYTDGLVERRGEVIDQGIERLRRALAEGNGDLEALADVVVTRMVDRDRLADDLALVLVRVGTGPSGERAP